MRDTEEEYTRIYMTILNDFSGDIINRINGLENRSLYELIQKRAHEIYEASNADFNDNFNPEHAAEQGEFNRDAKREDGVPF